MNTVRITVWARSCVRARRWLVVLVAGAALSSGFVAPAYAAGGPPIGRIYDCYGYGTAVPTLIQALELKTKTTYLVAGGRKGKSLSGPVSKGTYKLRGKKLTFLTGPYAKIHWHGVWTLRTLKDGGDFAHIGMFTAKGQEPMECYPQ